MTVDLPSAGSEADSEEGSQQAGQGAPAGGRSQVSFLTACLMGVALTFHSLLEVRHALTTPSPSDTKLTFTSAPALQSPRLVVMSWLLLAQMVLSESCVQGHVICTQRSHANTLVQGAALQPALHAM